MGRLAYFEVFCPPVSFFSFLFSFHGGDGLSGQSVAPDEHREIQIVKPPLVSHGSPSESDDHAVWR